MIFSPFSPQWECLQGLGRLWLCALVCFGLWFFCFWLPVDLQMVCWVLKTHNASLARLHFIVFSCKPASLSGVYNPSKPQLSLAITLKTVIPTDATCASCCSMKRSGRVAQVSCTHLLLKQIAQIIVMQKSGERQQPNSIADWFLGQLHLVRWAALGGVCPPGHQSVAGWEVTSPP